MVMAGITHNSTSSRLPLAIHPPFLEHESSANRKSAYPSGVSEKIFRVDFFLKELGTEQTVKQFILALGKAK